MRPKIGETIIVSNADSTEEHARIVVGYDMADNPVTMPAEVAESSTKLEQHLGLQNAGAVRAALATRARVLMEVA